MNIFKKAYQDFNRFLDSRDATLTQDYSDNVLRAWFTVWLRSMYMLGVLSLGSIIIIASIFLSYWLFGWFGIVFCGVSAMSAVWASIDVSVGKEVYSKKRPRFRTE